MIADLQALTIPDLSSDIVVLVGVLRESTDSGTIDGLAHGFAYTGGTIRLRFQVLTNSSPSNSLSATGSVNVRRWTEHYVRGLTGASATIRASRILAQDASGADVGLSLPNAPGSDPVWGESPIYPFVAAFRVTTTDTTTRAVGIDVGGRLMLDVEENLS